MAPCGRRRAGPGTVGTVRQHGSRNLYQEHDAAWSAAWTTGRCTACGSWSRAGTGQLVAVAHWNKFLKGALVRFLVEHPGVGPEELAQWEHPSGFVLDPTMTVESDDGVQLHLVKQP